MVCFLLPLILFYQVTFLSPNASSLRDSDSWVASVSAPITCARVAPHKYGLHSNMTHLILFCL